MALLLAAMLCGGCSTVDKIKKSVAPEAAPAKKTAAAPEPEAHKKTAAHEPSTTRKTSSPTDAAQPNAPRAAAQAALAEGIGLYEKGQFNAAIRRLNAPEISTADASVQTRALKYKAFSYCVTSRKALCERQFEKALKIDPAFDLEPGEKGHPLWGSVFDQAKKRD